MVKDYIATEVGDKIIAKLATPYLNVNNVFYFCKCIFLRTKEK